VRATVQGECVCGDRSVGEHILKAFGVHRVTGTVSEDEDELFG
jgi:hypothetical protein